ncbi:hypothetical protein R3P38DRAFT_3175033 [Favolaschia claudopus]|uniref:Uncharacterized protein n=1 Tax=Favolaschia claudopus TaxID=2862362 RepID=A0AAW0DD81_9AGAR
MILNDIVAVRPFDETSPSKPPTASLWAIDIPDPMFPVPLAHRDVPKFTPPTPRMKTQKSTPKFRISLPESVAKTATFAIGFSMQPSASGVRSNEASTTVAAAPSHGEAQDTAAASDRLASIDGDEATPPSPFSMDEVQHMGAALDRLASIDDEATPPSPLTSIDDDDATPPSPLTSMDEDVATAPSPLTSMDSDEEEEEPIKIPPPSNYTRRAFGDLFPDWSAEELRTKQEYLEEIAPIYLEETRSYSCQDHSDLIQVCETMAATFPSLNNYSHNWATRRLIVAHLKSQVATHRNRRRKKALNVSQAIINAEPSGHGKVHRSSNMKRVSSAHSSFFVMLYDCFTTLASIQKAKFKILKFIDACCLILPIGYTHFWLTVTRSRIHDFLHPSV